MGSHTKLKTVKFNELRIHKQTRLAFIVVIVIPVDAAAAIFRTLKQYVHRIDAKKDSISNTILALFYRIQATAQNYSVSNVFCSFQKGTRPIIVVCFSIVSPDPFRSSTTNCSITHDIRALFHPIASHFMSSLFFSLKLNYSLFFLDQPKKEIRWLFHI